MGLINNVRRILTQDYADEHRTLIGKLSEILNSFMVEVSDNINGNIDFNNLRQQLKTFKVLVDASGNVTSGNQIRLELPGRVLGIKCINARNLNDSSVYPTSTPFISFIQNNLVIKLNNITSLQSNSDYELTVVIQYDNR